MVLARGFSTTDPICLISDAGRGFIVTPTKEGVQAIDTEPWHQFRTSDNEEVNEHFLGRLKSIAVVAANLNSRGINHADGQLRNYWVTPNGTIEAFDWESAEIVQDPPNPDTLVRLAVSTLRPLYRSLENRQNSENKQGESTI